MAYPTKGRLDCHIVTDTGDAGNKRMEMIKIDHIGLRVMDFDRSIQFYERLGFEVTRQDHKERVTVMKHPSGVELNFLDSGNDDYGGKNVLMDTDARFPGYTHYAIEVASVHDSKMDLESIGIVITEGPVTFGDKKTSIFLRDPDLNVIEFTQLPRR